MATNLWNRVRWNNYPWSSAQQTIGLIGMQPGWTLMRIRFGWGFGGTTVSSVVVSSICGHSMAWGIVTTIGNGTESVPDPILFANDISPPSQRWLWHESRAPTVVAFDAAAATFCYGSTQPNEPSDAHGQVLAPTSMPGGDTLNVWVTFRAETNWDPSGDMRTWGFANVLYRTP